MALFRLLHAAERDLATIRDYTSQEWGAAQTKRYLLGLHRRLVQLAAFPKSAPLAVPGSLVRIALYGRHRILFREIDGGIEIGRILHQARDLTRALERYVQLAARKET